MMMDKVVLVGGSSEVYVFTIAKDGQAVDLDLASEVKFELRTDGGKPLYGPWFADSATPGADWEKGIVPVLIEIPNTVDRWYKDLWVEMRATLADGQVVGKLFDGFELAKTSLA